jgi:hypothetical protein
VVTAHHRLLSRKNPSTPTRGARCDGAEVSPSSGCVRGRLIGRPYLQARRDGSFRLHPAGGGSVRVPLMQQEGLGLRWRERTRDRRAQFAALFRHLR